MFEFIKIILSAFCGAWFAYIFMKYLEKNISRKEKVNSNIKALYKIQQICNENISTSDQIIYSIDEIIRIFTEAEQRNQDPFSMNRIDILSLNKDLLLDLLNVDFINDYFSHYQIIQKHNDDAKASNDFKNSMHLARLNGNISSENYLENMNRYKDDLIVFRKLVLDLMEKIKTMNAKCRVLLKTKKSFWQKHFQKNLIEKYDDKFPNKLKKELLLLSEEMKGIREASKKEIEKTLNS